MIAQIIFRRQGYLPSMAATLPHGGDVSLSVSCYYGVTS
jgi:hypothetical protein